MENGKIRINHTRNYFHSLESPIRKSGPPYYILKPSTSNFKFPWSDFRTSHLEFQTPLFFFFFNNTPPPPILEFNLLIWHFRTPTIKHSNPPFEILRPLHSNSQSPRMKMKKKTMWALSIAYFSFLFLSNSINDSLRDIHQMIKM